MRIGYSYWGICADYNDHFNSVDTADGSRYTRPILVRELLKRGHTVIAQQQRLERVPFRDMMYDYPPFLDIDLLLLEWRWPTYKNYGPGHKDPDLDRQQELIQYYHGKCPIVVWDLDNQYKNEVPGAIVAEPSLNPREGRVQLMPCTDWRPLFPVREPLPIYGYVGNNYDRRGAFDSYYFEPARHLKRIGIQTTMIGNWLQKSPARESPEDLVMRTIANFVLRLDWATSMALMNKFVCTTHVSKPDYEKLGFVPPRYLEAAICGCPALTPLGAVLPIKSVDPLDVADAVERIKGFNSRQRTAYVINQIDTLRATELFDVSKAVKTLEELA